MPMELLLRAGSEHGQGAQGHRRQEGGLGAGQDVADAVGLGLVRRHLGDDLRRRDADRYRQAELVFDALADQRRGLGWRADQRLAAGDVDVRLVEAAGLHERAVAVEDGMKQARDAHVLGVIAAQVDGMRGEADGGANRHGAVHAELARFIRSGRDDAAAAWDAADHDRFAEQIGIARDLDSHEEGVEVHVQDAARAGESLKRWSLPPSLDSSTFVLWRQVLVSTAVE